MSERGTLEDLSVISPWLPTHGPHSYSWASTSGGAIHFYIIQQKGTLEYAPSNLYLNVKCPLKLYVPRAVHLGACYKCRITGPIPDPLNQNLHLKIEVS